MILENTYCKGTWQNRSTETYTINQQALQVTHNTEGQTNLRTYEDCAIQDRKNWTCTDTLSNKNMTVKDGKLLFDEKSDIRQITRLQWLQNKVLSFIN